MIENFSNDKVLNFYQKNLEKYYLNNKNNPIAKICGSNDKPKNIQ